MLPLVKVIQFERRAEVYTSKIIERECSNFMCVCVCVYNVNKFQCILFRYVIMTSSFADTENIRFVFAAVKDTILQSNLKEYNLV